MLWNGGGGLAGGGWLDGSGLGGSMKRGPQSLQSVPYAQVSEMASASPSWQYELFPYKPPRPDACARQSSVHSMGGGGGGDEGGGKDGGAGGGGGGEGRGGEGGE